MANIFEYKIRIESNSPSKSYTVIDIFGFTGIEKESEATAQGLNYKLLGEIKL